MGLEQLGFAIVWEMTSGIASILGMIFVLVGWIRVVVGRATGRNRRMSLSLCTLSIAVAAFPISIGIYREVPYSMQDRYICGEKVGVVYYLAFSAFSVLLLIVSLAASHWESSAAKGVVKAGTLTMLCTYALGIAAFAYLS